MCHCACVCVYVIVRVCVCADDHDVLHFLTHSLHVPGSDAAQVGVH